MLLALALEGWALQPGRKIWHYGYAQWQDRDGLPQNTVQAIAQSTDGYIWLGTEAGLVRFNGRAFRTYTQANTPEMRSDSVLSLLARPDGGLWVGTRSGLILRRGEKSRSISKGMGSHEGIRALAQDEAGNLWVGTNRGVTRVAAGQEAAGRYWTQADG
ncbi:two-component regulator propeller domain-containing protein, partial [Nostoc sp. NIES-2111]